ncbi:hypothetical protein D3C76_1019090 [compost metagenome]
MRGDKNGGEQQRTLQIFNDRISTSQPGMRQQRMNYVERVGDGGDIKQDAVIQNVGNECPAIE